MSEQFARFGVLLFATLSGTLFVSYLVPTNVQASMAFGLFVFSTLGYLHLLVFGGI